MKILKISKLHINLAKPNILAKEQSSVALYYKTSYKKEVYQILFDYLEK